MTTAFLRDLEHLDAHFAHGIEDNTQHIRMVGQNGELITLCGTTFFDWVRTPTDGEQCPQCLEDMADLLMEKVRPQPPKYEHLDWYKERNLLRAMVYEHRN